jgi:SAM-dependent methyltransferase
LNHGVQFFINSIPPSFELQPTAIGRKMSLPKAIDREYEKNLAQLKKEPGDFYVFEERLKEGGRHPANFIDIECAFAADHLRRFNPGNVLDVGSYRLFILGLLANFPITTIDVRSRQPLSSSETILTGDAKKINLPDHCFDAVLSLCALEHFGLGRYGDEFDLHADQKAFAEMIRVLKPGGRLIFTTTIHRAQPSIAFNAHRIYTYEMLRSFCRGLTFREEKFYSHRQKGFCPLAEVTTDLRWWDVYCGCWEKK